MCSQIWNYLKFPSLIRNLNLLVIPYISSNIHRILHSTQHYRFNPNSSETVNLERKIQEKPFGFHRISFWLELNASFLLFAVLRLSEKKKNDRFQRWNRLTQTWSDRRKERQRERERRQDERPAETERRPSVRYSVIKRNRFRLQRRRKPLLLPQITSSSDGIREYVADGPFVRHVVWMFHNSVRMTVLLGSFI